MIKFILPAVCCMTTLFILKCDCTEFPIELQNTVFDTYDHNSARRTLGQIGVGDVRYEVVFLDPPVIYNNYKPDKYNCVQSSGQYYLMKSELSTTPGDPLMPAGESNFYMCLKLFEYNNRFAMYYLGESIATSNPAFVTRGITTIRPIGQEITDEFFCEACGLHTDDTGTVFPGDLDYEVIDLNGIVPDLPVEPFPSVGTDVPLVCETDDTPPSDESTFCQVFLDHLAENDIEVSADNIGKRDMRGLFQSLIQRHRSNKGKGNGKWKWIKGNGRLNKGKGWTKGKGKWNKWKGWNKGKHWNHGFGSSSHSEESDEHDPCTCPANKVLIDMFQSLITACHIIVPPPPGDS